MFANFTGETATGTGDTLTLTGAMTGHIQFGKSFSDGDPVAYAVVDSGGAIKVAGIGTYNTTGDTITRNDSWNYNGTVIDKDPATNIALSAGTHTVICDAVANTTIASVGFAVNIGDPSRNTVVPFGWLNSNQADSPVSADLIRVLWSPLHDSVKTSSIDIDVTLLPAAAGAVYIFGLYRIKFGSGTAELLWSSTVQDGDSATGITGKINMALGASYVIGQNDLYGVAFSSNNSGIEIRGSSLGSSTRGFGTFSWWSGGEPLPMLDYMRVYDGILPATIDVSTGIVGDYRTPVGFLRFT